MASPTKCGGLANRSVEILPKVTASGGDQRRKFKRYLLMAIGSADEMQVWLKYAADLKYMDQAICERWRDEYRQIARMLQGLYSKLSTRLDP